MFGQLVSFGNLVPSFPIGIAAIFFFLQSHYTGMLRYQHRQPTNKPTKIIPHWIPPTDTNYTKSWK